SRFHENFLSAVRRPSAAERRRARIDGRIIEDEVPRPAPPIRLSEEAPEEQPVSRELPESSHELPAPSRKRRDPELKPFAPLGIGAGMFRLYPLLEQGIGWTSNVDSSPDGGAAVFSETTLRLRGHTELPLHHAE